MRIHNVRTRLASVQLVSTIDGVMNYGEIKNRDNNIALCTICKHTFVKVLHGSGGGFDLFPMTSIAFIRYEGVE